MKYLFTLATILSLNLTAYSQITGIPRENKEEIVKTLYLYPLIVEHRNSLIEKNLLLKGILSDERKRISIYEGIIKNKELELKNLKKQKSLYEKQLKKSRSGMFVYGSLPITDLTSPEVGILLQIQNKMFVSSSFQYNNFIDRMDLKIGLGIKIW